MDWSVVPLSAAVSAAVSITIRWLDKPRPHLVATLRGVSLPIGDEHLRSAYGAPVTVANHGDGPAFDLQLAGSGCVVGVRRPPAHTAGTDSWDDRIASLKPGETIILDVQNWTENDQDALVVVTHPRLKFWRWWRRSWIFALADMQAENPFPAAMYSPEKIPWVRRHLGAIDHYGLRARLRKVANEPDEQEGEDDDGV